MDGAIIVINHQLQQRLLGLRSENDGPVELNEDLFGLDCEKCVAFAEEVEEY